MRKIILWIFLLGGIQSLIGQDAPLKVIKKSINVSLPFYTIVQIGCKKNGQRERPTYSVGITNEFIVFGKYYKFSVFDGQFLDETKANTGLLKDFNIYIEGNRYKGSDLTRTLKVCLQEKDHEKRCTALFETIETKLQQAFPSYKIHLKTYISKKQGSLAEKWSFYVNSHTGGDEFETTEKQKERVKKMQQEITPLFNRLIQELHTNRMIKLQRELINPYRKAVQLKWTPKKLNTFYYDIEQLKDYEADKQQFSSFTCKGFGKIHSAKIPPREARILRENTNQYQVRIYIYKGRTSHPVAPQDAFAFGFYEIIHKETKELLCRVRKSYSPEPNKTYYNYTLWFPRF